MHISIQIYFASAEIRHGWVKVSTWKRKPVTLMVSIPRSLVSVQASTGLYSSPCPIRDTYSDCSDTPPSEYSPLTVSFPLAQFMKCSVLQWDRSRDFIHMHFFYILKSEMSHVASYD